MEKHIIILLGPPGSGKGSQALLLKNHLNIPHISTGDLLREHISKGTELGRIFSSYVNAGKLGPDNLIIEMLLERIAKPDCKNGYILDGFPRTLEQAKQLDKHISNQNVLTLNLEISDKIIVERLSQRLICKNCGAPYHKKYAPPKISGKCDICSGELYQRKDDDAAIVKDRLIVYHSQTSPLIDFYREKNNLVDIACDQSKEEVFNSIQQKITL